MEPLWGRERHRVERQGHVAPYCLTPTPRDIIPQQLLNLNGVVLRENCHPPLFYLPLPVDNTCVWVTWVKIVDYIWDASWTMFHAEHWWKTGSTILLICCGLLPGTVVSSSSGLRQLGLRITTVKRGCAAMACKNNVCADRRESF